MCLLSIHCTSSWGEKLVIRTSYNLSHKVVTRTSHGNSEDMYRWQIKETILSPLAFSRPAENKGNMLACSIRLITRNKVSWNQTRLFSDFVLCWPFRVALVIVASMRLHSSSPLLNVTRGFFPLERRLRPINEIKL